MLQIGVHYSPATHAVTWYVKQPFGPEAGTRNIGSCKLIPNLAETIYPCFAIYSKRTVIQVEFPPQVLLVFSSSNFAISCKILQIFRGLVLGCIKTKFCKKICV